LWIARNAGSRWWYVPLYSRTRKAGCWAERRGIKIVSFAAGAVDEILEAYVNGNIYRKDYRMPGCETGNDTTL